MTGTNCYLQGIKMNELHPQKNILISIRGIFITLGVRIKITLEYPSGIHRQNSSKYPVRIYWLLLLFVFFEVK